MFGGQDHHHNSGPIGNGVAEERSEMLFLVAHGVQQNPCDKDATGDNRQAVPLKECLVLFIAYREFQDGLPRAGTKSALDGANDSESGL